MCGRYTHLFTWKQLRRLMSLTSPEAQIPMSYNVAPTHAAPVVRPGPAGPPLTLPLPTDAAPSRELAREPARELAMLRWGLVPSWSKDSKGGAQAINARSETVATNGLFRTAFKRRRCLVPVSGFYEWRKQPTPEGATAPRKAARPAAKQPYYITSSDGEPLVFAGLWEWWRDRDAPPDTPGLETFAILTTTANELMAKIHDRMPVILDPADFSRWLETSEEDAGGLVELLRPYPSELMVATPVSTLVNSPRNTGPECIQPFEITENAPRRTDESQGGLWTA